MGNLPIVSIIKYMCFPQKRTLYANFEFIEARICNNLQTVKWFINTRSLTNIGSLIHQLRGIPRIENFSETMPLE